MAISCISAFFSYCCPYIASSSNAVQQDPAPWVFVDKRGNEIAVEWGASSDLESLRSVYIEAFLDHDLYKTFLDVTDLPAATNQLSKYWDLRIAHYAPQFDRHPPEALLAVAKKNAKTVGFVLFDMKKPEEAFVSPIAIHPSMQGAGLGKELIFSILRQKPDVKRIYLGTGRTNNDQTIAFYRHIGFKEFKQDGVDNNKYVFFEWLHP